MWEFLGNKWDINKDSATLLVSKDNVLEIFRDKFSNELILKVTGDGPFKLVTDEVDDKSAIQLLNQYSLEKNISDSSLSLKKPISHYMNIISLSSENIAEFITESYDISSENLYQDLLLIDSLRPDLYNSALNSLKHYIEWLKETKHEDLKELIMPIIEDVYGNEFKEGVLDQILIGSKGIQLKSKKGSDRYDRYALLTDDPYEAGFVRATYFNETGITGHDSSVDYHVLLDLLYVSGFNELVSGKLEELAISDSFKKGFEINNIFQEMNAEISDKKLRESRPPSSEIVDEIPSQKPDIDTTPAPSAPTYEQDPHEAYKLLNEEFEGRVGIYNSESGLPSDAYFISSGENNQRYTLRHKKDGYIGNLTESPEYAIRTALKKVGKDKVYFNPDLVLGKIERTQSVKTPKSTPLDLQVDGEIRFGFGKHSGKSVNEVYEEDPGYLEWLSSNGVTSGTRDFKHTIKHYGEMLKLEKAERNKVPDDIDFKALRKKLSSKGISIEKTAKNINVYGLPFTVGSEPLYRPMRTLFGDINFNKNHSCWQILSEYSKDSDVELRACWMVDVLLTDLHDRQQNKVDKLLSNKTDKFIDGDSKDKVGENVKSLIMRGSKIGIPINVLEDQIDDIGRALAAYEKGKPAFLLSNEPGTGKTFVLGGIIEELKTQHSESKVIYLTMSQDLISQIKKDLQSFDIEHVQFATYAALGKGDVYCDDETIVLADESHNLLNVGSNRGLYGQQLFSAAKFVVPASATSMENPVQAEYLAATGIFDGDEVGGFEDWASTFGAIAQSFYGRTSYTWGGDLELAKRSRDWFINQGIITQRKMSIPEKQILNEYKDVKVTSEWIDLYDKVEAAYEYALYDEDGEEAVNFGRIKEHSVNTLKRILEAAKVDPAIIEAKSALRRGRNPIIFVETKADRYIGKFRISGSKPSSQLYNFDEMDYMMSEWEIDKNIALSMGDSVSAPPFAGFIYDIAKSFNKHGINYELPSVPQQIKAAFDKKIVTEYTGAVTAAKATKNLADWKSGKKKLLIATMAKGGTGQSYHDTVGDHPTTQIVINLPWASRTVDQVAGRTVRYGMVGEAELSWLFATELNIENKLMDKVSKRMADLGASVNGVDHKGSAAIKILQKNSKGGPAPWAGTAAHREGEFYGYKISLIPVADYLIAQGVKPHEAYVHRVYNKGELLEVSKQPHGDSYRVSEKDYSIGVIGRDHSLQEISRESAIRFYMKTVTESDENYRVVDAVVPLRFIHNESEFEAIAQYGKSVPLSQARKGIKTSIYIKKLAVVNQSNSPELVVQSFKLNGRDIITEEGHSTPASLERVQQFREFGLNIPFTEIKSNSIETNQKVRSASDLQNVVTAKIMDAGEHIPGAIKDKIKNYLEVLNDSEIDIFSDPLSKILPHPDYKELSANGVRKEPLALVSMLRASVPRKTKKSGRAWVNKVKETRSTISDLLSKDDYFESFMMEAHAAELGATRNLVRTLDVFEDLPLEMYKEAGKFRIKEAFVSYYKGKELDEDTNVYYLTEGGDAILDVSGENLKTVILQAASEIEKRLISKPNRSNLPKLNTYTSNESKKSFVGYKGGQGVVNLRFLPEDIIGREARYQYLQRHYDEIAEELAGRKNVAARLDANSDRSGPSINSQGITVETLRERFGLKAVQWGETTLKNQKEAKIRLIQAHESLIDLSNLLDIPPAAIGLDGTLSLAFGARGKGGLSKSGGKTLATYEPDYSIINLTREGGAGSLAHEWFHALDNYLVKSLKGDSQKIAHSYATGSKKIVPKKVFDGELIDLDSLDRSDLLEAIEALKKSVNDNAYHEYAKDLDGLFSRKEAYWSSSIEKTARAFERYVKDGLKENGVKNDFLVNINESSSSEGGVYPSASQMKEFGIERSFDLLFRSLKPVKTEFGLALYRVESEAELLLGAWVDAFADDHSSREFYIETGQDLEVMLEGLGFDTEKTTNSVRIAGEGDRIEIIENGNNVRIELNGLEPEPRKAKKIFRGILDYCHSSNKCLQTLTAFDSIDCENELLLSVLKHGDLSHILKTSTPESGSEFLAAFYTRVKNLIPEVDNLCFESVTGQYGTKPNPSDLAIRMANALNTSNDVDRDLFLDLIKDRLPSEASHLVDSSLLKRAVIIKEFITSSEGLYSAASDLLTASVRATKVTGILHKKEATLAVNKFSQADLVSSWIKPVEEHTGVIVNVVPSVSDLPKHLVSSVGANTPGVYDIKRMQSYVIADRIKNKSHAIKVAYHEGIGHKGFISFLERNTDHGGDEVVDVLDGIYKEVGEREIAKATSAYGFNLKDPKDRREAVLEYVALMAEMGHQPIKVNQVVNSSKAMIESLHDQEVVWTRNDILGLLEASRLHAIIEKSKTGGIKLDSEQIDNVEEVKISYERLLNANDGRLKKLLGRSKGIITWHGSPSLFSAFDISKVNSGEGAQHEGWGLYSAEQKSIASNYERLLTSRQVKTPIGTSSDWDIESALSNNTPQLMAFKLFQENDRNWAKVKDVLKQDNVNKDILEAAVGLELKLKPLDRGYVYQLEIKAEEQDIARWDHPLSEQSEVVKSFFDLYRDEMGYEKTLAELLNDWKPAYLDEVSLRSGDVEAVSDALDVICFEDEYQESAWDVIISNPSFHLDPNDMYDFMQRADRGPNGMKFLLSDAMSALEDIGVSGSPQESTAIMLAAGIKGISYQNADSEIDTSRNLNYVIFDDSLINIISTEYVEKSQKINKLRESLGLELNPSVISLLNTDNYLMLDQSIVDQPALAIPILKGFKRALKLDVDDEYLLTEKVYSEIVEKVFAGSDFEASAYLLKKGVSGLKLITSYYKGSPVYETVDFNSSIVAIDNQPPAHFKYNQHLNMDKESRLARAEIIGFDTSTIFFHGTSEDFDAFDDRLTTHYFTTRPEYGYIRNSANVYPVYLKMENTYLAKTQSEIEMLRSAPEKVQELKSLGFDSASWHLPGNLNKGGSGWGNDYPQFVVFRADQIRSINAKFNLESDHAGILQKLSVIDDYLSSDNRKIRAKQLGYRTEDVFYHGSTMEFETLSPNSMGSMFGRGVYLTTSPEDASKYASLDPFINHDIPGKAEHLSTSLGITYSEAKDLLRVNEGSVTPCYLREGDYLSITHEGMFYNDKPMHSFNNAKGLQMAIFAGIDDAEDFLKNLDRINEGEVGVRRLVENLTGDPHASKGVAIMGLMRAYNAYGFPREMAITLNCNYIKLGKGIAPKAPKDAEHVISINGGQDIRSINARFDLKAEASDLLLAKIDAKTGNSEFDTKFGNSVVTKNGDPLVVYRGQHGSSEDLIHTRSKAISFSSSLVASEYSMQPNFRSDKGESPHIVPAYLKIEKPFIRNENDPFIDMNEIANKLDLNQQEAIDIAMLFQEAIEGTDNFFEIAEENEVDNLAELLKKNPATVSDLYFDSYQFFDNDGLIEKMKSKGFDGAIHTGNGTSSEALEYKVFSSEQIIPKLDYPNIGPSSNIEGKIGSYLSAEVEQVGSLSEISVKNNNVDLSVSLISDVIHPLAISAYGFNAAGLKVASINKLVLKSGNQANAKNDIELLSSVLKSEGYDSLIIEGASASIYSHGDLDLNGSLVKSLSERAIESLPTIPRLLFAGIESNYDNHSNLEHAKLLENEAVSEEDIWEETGWYKGVDDQWRYEIKDDSLKLNQELLLSQLNRVKNGDDRGILAISTLGKIMEHDALFASYPKLKDFKVVLLNGGDYSSVKGTADSQRISLYIDKRASLEGIKSILLHETQHVIQDLEGFAVGSSISDEATRKIRKIALMKLEKNEYKKADNEYLVIRSEMKRYSLMRQYDRFYSLAHNDSATRQASKFYNTDEYALNAGYVIDRLGLPPKKYKKHEHNMWLQGASLLICGVIEREFEDKFTLSLIEEKKELELTGGKNAVTNNINQLLRKYKKIHPVLLSKHDDTEMLRKIDGIKMLDDSNEVLYRASAGEVEARLVEVRLAENDYKSFPLQMNDTPRNKQFVFTGKEIGSIAKSLSVDEGIFKIIDKVSDLPRHIRASLPRSNNARISGITYGHEIFILKDGISSQEELEKTMTHECSHIGVGSVFGEETSSSYGAFWIAIGRTEGLLEKAQSMGQDLNHYVELADNMYGNGTITNSQRISMLVDEFVAHSSINKNYSSLSEKLKKSMNELLGGIREGLRSVGLKGLCVLKTSDIFYLCRQINRASRGNIEIKKPFIISPQSPNHQQYSWEIEVISALKNSGLTEKECVLYAESNDHDMSLGFSNKIQPVVFALTVFNEMNLNSKKERQAEKFTRPLMN